MRSSRSVAPVLAALLLSATAAACGDSVSGLGDFGRVTYRLAAQYEIEETDLRAARIVTRHEQTLTARLTTAGQSFVDEPEQVRHAAADGSPVLVETRGTGRVSEDEDGRRTESIPSLAVRADSTGSGTVETLEDDTLVDRIELQFEEPESLEAILWVHGPDEGDEWERVEPPLSVEAGTELSAIVAPLAADGGRLVGSLEPELSTEPPAMTAPVWAPVAVYEDGLWSVDPANTVTVLFLQAGEVSVQLQDVANGVGVDFLASVGPRTEEEGR